MSEPEHRLTVLVVEDEELTRSVLCRTMQSEGYQVFTAADGQEALKLLAKPSAVDLVVTDVCMPKMDGRELGIVLAERYPELPILFVSAYTGSVTPANLPGPLLPKPFRPMELIARIRQLMTGGNDSPDTAAASPPMTWKPSDNTDREVRAWMKAKDWEVSRTDYDADREVYAWRHDVRGGPPLTLRISRQVLENYPAFVVLYQLDQLQVAQAIRARPEARLFVVQNGTQVALEES